MKSAEVHATQKDLGLEAFSLEAKAERWDEIVFPQKEV